MKILNKNINLHKISAVLLMVFSGAVMSHSFALSIILLVIGISLFDIKQFINTENGNNQ